MKAVPLLLVLCASTLLASATPAKAAVCVPQTGQMEADLGLAEFTTVCAVEELLEIIRSVDCALGNDLTGNCVFCPPSGGTSNEPAGRMRGSDQGVFVAYFPAGFGQEGLVNGPRGFHVIFIPTTPGACEATA